MIVLGESGARRTAQAAREAIAAEVGARLDLRDDAYVYKRDGVERRIYLKAVEGGWQVQLEIAEQVAA